MTAQWASSAYQGEGRFDLSTFNDIEMNYHGEAYHIDIPSEFSEWNREAVRTSSISAYFYWDTVALEIENMIKSRDSLKEGLTDAR